MQLVYIQYLLYHIRYNKDLLFFMISSIQYKKSDKLYILFKDDSSLLFKIPDKLYKIFDITREITDINIKYHN